MKLSTESHFSLSSRKTENIFQPSSMACKMKGLLKGIKYFTHIFVHKEHEMEIGYPTDVKHVAHIGFDNPFWMDEFKSASDFSGSLSNYESAHNSWVSQGILSLSLSLKILSLHDLLTIVAADFDRPRELQTASAMFMDHRLPRIPKAPPSKTKQKKNKVASPASSARSTRSSTSRTSYSTAIEVGGEITGSQEWSMYRS
ncbi:Plastocyanin-like domain [Musa troglodytarum]|uniref:Plastocyanin-like domain n=1 Tax=Musa troglodytarum TaxID=320322 RepID=A0A9E7ES60_9LILI|nr:Plastocyanin-like domain [Musa troglodytarum]